MPSSTIYASRNLDAVFAASALAATLCKKGYRIFVEFPRPSDMSKVSIVNSYSVDITHLNTVQIRNSVAITHIPMKRLGYVYKYDNDGRYNVMMKLSNVNSTLEVVLEYVKILNDSIHVNQELLKDIARIKLKEMQKLTRMGRTIYYAYMWGVGRDETLLSLYNYAYTIFTSKNMKLSPEIERDAKNYEYALSLINTVVKENRYDMVGDIATVILSSKYDGNELVRGNINYLKVVANELLSNLCREHRISAIVDEDVSGHSIRLCINRNLSVDASKIIERLPNEILGVIDYKATKNYAYIVFRNSELATLENMLKLLQKLSSNNEIVINQTQ